MVSSWTVPTNRHGSSACVLERGDGGSGAFTPRRATMMATDARFTLAQLKHWDTRLSQELEILEHDIEASEATHHKCAQPSRCVCHSRPDVEGLSQVRRQVLRGAPRAACLARREGVALG